MSKPIIQLNEESVKSELKELVRNSVEVNSQSKFHSGIWSGIYRGKDFVVEFSLGKGGSRL